MKRLKEMTALKKLNILTAVILGFFASANIFWALTAGLPNYGYKARLNIDVNDTMDTMDEVFAMYQKEIDGLLFVVRKKPYLQGRGFLAVYKEYTVDLSTNTDNGKYICLYIYPGRFGGYKYVVQFAGNNNDDGEDTMEFVPVDDSLNYLPNDQYNTRVNERSEELLNEYHDEIKLRMDAAQNIWKLDENDTLYGLKAFITDFFEK